MAEKSDEPSGPTRNGKLAIPLDFEDALRVAVKAKPPEKPKRKPRKKIKK